MSLSEAAEAMRTAVLDERQGPPLTGQIRGLAALLLYGAREMHREAGGLAEALARHPVLRALPPREAWRLCVDERAVGDGLHAGLRFDNEPGYMGGMYRALALMATQDVQGRRLDAGAFVALHDTAVHGVFVRGTLSQGLAMPGPIVLQAIKDLTAPQARFPEFLQCCESRDALYGADGDLPGIRQIRKGLRASDETTTVSLTLGSNASEAGLAELKAKGEPWCRVAQGVGMGVGRLATTNKLCTQPRSGDELMGRIQECLDDCRRGCTAAAGDAGLKLRAIAACCQDLEQLHPFPDGNARTVGVLVLNKLLLEQGLPPAALEDANRLDAFSLQEVVREIEVGQERFEQLTRNPGTPVA